MNNNHLTQKFSDLQPQFAEKTADLHRLILSIFPATTPTFDGENAGYGIGSRYKDLMFIITPHSQHVNLGITNDASLEDPHDLLEGKGKVHRHVKLCKIEDVSDPNLEDLMQRALTAAHKRFEIDI